MDVHRMRYLVMYWFALAQLWYRWMAVISAVMNLWVPQITGNSRLAEDLLAFQEGLCCLDLLS